jgi:aminoglycoside 6'-N-acetyltransferase I
VIIKVLGRGDDPVLHRVAPGAFDNPIDPELTENFLKSPASHRRRYRPRLVVGFASGVHYVHPDKPPQLWINEVAVAPAHRRRGLATAVLRALLAVGQQYNCTEAWVLTDRTNVAAMALYASLGGIQGADRQGPSDATLGYSFTLNCEPGKWH